jgi:hypothetical protein
LKQIIVSILFILLFVSCKKTQEQADCANTVIAFSTAVSPSDACFAEGSISITATGNYLYKLNTGTFSTASVFNNLLPGKYAVTVKNNSNCIKTDSVVVPVKNAGPLFIQTKNVLATYCISCHSGINPQAGLDWTVNCTIVNNQVRIKARAIDGNPTTMPPTGFIPIAERNKILAWINAGGKFTD